MNALRQRLALVVFSSMAGCGQDVAQFDATQKANQKETRHG